MVDGDITVPRNSQPILMLFFNQTHMKRTVRLKGEKTEILGIV